MAIMKKGESKAAHFVTEIKFIAYFLSIYYMFKNFKLNDIILLGGYKFC